MRRRLLRLVATLVAVTALAWAPLAGARLAAQATRPTPAADAVPMIVRTPAADVLALARSQQHALPPELAGVDPARFALAWLTWASEHDRAIRARIDRGHEDSLVNLWLFGTSFTALPPARPADVAERGNGQTLAEVTARRLDDFLSGLASARTNERLRFGQAWFSTRGVDVTTRDGRRRAATVLTVARDRMVAENAEYARALTKAGTTDGIGAALGYASLYRDRGLSADTSLLPAYAVDVALTELAETRRVATGSVRRVAIVGPGLDFMNKADGHDFYPEQTVQPFALADSLLRLELAPADLQIVTFDINARVNQHLEAARGRARAGTPYVLQLPLAGDERWQPSLLAYWTRLGQRIGDAAMPAAAPRTAGRVRMRAVRVRPETVTTVTPLDVNVIVERLDLPTEQAFDLIVATNVFAYYDGFEQALAVANLGRMLRPGGSMLSNQAVLPVTPMIPDVGRTSVVYSDRQRDDVFWYRRQ